MAAPDLDLRRLVRGAILFAFLALFWATENPWQSAIAGHPLGSPFGTVLFYWSVHWAVWGALALFIARLARRFPPGARRPANVALHLAAALAIGSFQLVVMRASIYAIQGVFGESSFRESLTRDFQIFAHKNLLTYAAIVAATLGLDAFRRAKEQELRTARLAGQLAQAELAALRMQLHPHFLFNSLHSAAELVHENPAAAERAILGLADLLRRALRASERAEVTLAEELEFVDGYLALEGVRLEGKLEIDYRVPEELLELPVPSLLLQPLVENAVRHGVARRLAGGKIAIAAEHSGDRLQITVENDTPSPAAGTQPGSGIGLANVRARLAQLHGGAAQIEAVRIAPELFRARISLPFPAAVRASAPSGDPVSIAPTVPIASPGADPVFVSASGETS